MDYLQMLSIYDYLYKQANDIILADLLKFQEVLKRTH